MLQLHRFLDQHLHGFNGLFLTPTSFKKDSQPNDVNIKSRPEAMEKSRVFNDDQAIS